ncbi:peptidoglycan amidohydrolase family protein [Lactococcus lactis]|uniref:Peptidoglycan amidohydrolase family protein n=1 Tax=Lactococcus lactis TaxID=1358 RepID=A0ABD5GL14_9LACT|nr:peptidoglycan amidohydrolase family protein [Lactococcus lactis]MDQ7160094.1 peptidoglycan amidohydrolase family protein [Lactococcus lactis]MDV2617898.1 peptidoglycan amidohydrolase family protein [Lactococcus lactis]
MTLNIENGISALKQQIGRATYSMYGSRNFSDGTCDCSGAVYYGLTNGGVKPLGYIPSTETMHQWLLDNNYKLIAENSEWKMQAQDVIIWGRKGESAGAGGHTGIAVDGQNWIECTAWSGGGNGAEGGVIISNHDSRWAMNGCPYFYVYRSQQNSSTSDPTQTNLNNKESEEEEIMFFVETVEGKVYQIINGMYSYIPTPALYKNLKATFPNAKAIKMYEEEMTTMYRKNV